MRFAGSAQKPAPWIMKNKWFTNWTAEEFSYKWDGETLSFASGESKLLPDYLADHFGKHLTDRVLHSQNKTVNDHSRESLLAKCFATPEGEAAPISEDQSDVKATIEALNSEIPKKRGRPKKVEPEMEKFDGLNENEAVSV